MSDQRTPLFDLHVELGGRIVDFAGWSLPIQYEGVIAEHEWCRQSAALFDVSHMGIVSVTGDDPAASLETVTPAGVTTLGDGASRYCLLTNDDGGIIDDCIVTNAPALGTGDGLTVVVNAARRDADLAHLTEQLAECEVTHLDHLALLALQGPAAVAVVAQWAPSVAELTFMGTEVTQIEGTTVSVSRSGYTGEDGVEITVHADDAEGLARRLLADDRVRPAGLGARDTLRLEAGLCLYGSDLDETTSPIEAGLRWTIPKRRREAADFPGAARIVDELANGVSRTRVGLAPAGRRPVRDGAMLDIGGSPIGTVTSGGFGPSISRPVAMGYVAPEAQAVGTELTADVRGSAEPIVVADLPFVPHRYAR